MPPSQPVADDIVASLRAAIAGALPDAVVQVESHGGGHYSLVVSSASFRGRTMLENHRTVYGAITPLLSGPSAPVHAIDSLRCTSS